MFCFSLLLTVGVLLVIKQGGGLRGQGLTGDDVTDPTEPSELLSISAQSV